MLRIVKQKQYFEGIKESLEVSRWKSRHILVEICVYGSRKMMDACCIHKFMQEDERIIKGRTLKLKLSQLAWCLLQDGEERKTRMGLIIWCSMHVRNMDSCLFFWCPKTDPVFIFVSQLFSLFNFIHIHFSNIPYLKAEYFV